ncbi:hypothetical protein SAMN05421780_10670 [Flexibacter flexilis DSM 6793]|uniref:Outer membrane protein beta-barrel domain-containing protein n=1 Tax=Flexibacter flexilis DSM 6793 TaxID=927664 RepID=A0A1I1K0E5_9BACT|nr:hypothetical protein [Flexibacter flexilis]SFC51080.1 hypothetical protein SAMN05421780_10670 [Flexibacter flexilis DSM 6793]
MKKVCLLASSLLLATQTLTFAQNSVEVSTPTAKPKHEIAFDLGAFTTPIMSKNYYGVNFDIQYYPKQKWATGVSFSVAQHKISNPAGYSAQKPVLGYYEIAWANQYDLVQKDKFRLGFNLNNGVVVGRLGDNANQEKYWTQYGYSKSPKKVAANYFYMLAAGLEAAVKVYSHNHYPDVYVTSKAQYRWTFGDARFGTARDFSGYYVGVGVALIGFTDDEK